MSRLPSELLSLTFLQKCTPSWGLMQFGRQLTTTVARNARALSFGDGSHGALGHTDCFGGDAYEPEVVEGLPENITSVGAGHYHSMAVSRSGELWAWGRNSEGQLGERDEPLNSRLTWHVPQRVRGLESVDVASSRGSGVVSMAVAKDGSLWAWGTSKRGQLGLGPGVTHAPSPQRVEALSRKQVVQVALGWGHTLALTTEGHVYSWGYVANHRLGFQPFETPSNEPPSKGRDTGEAVEDVAYQQVLTNMEKERSPVLAWEPVHVDSLHHVTDVSCGMDHSLTLNEQGEVWSFGDNSLGQLGREVATATTPVERVQGLLAGERVCHVAAGLGHSLAVDAQGRVYSWGWNQETSALPACVGAGDEELQAEEVVGVAAGRAHSVARTSSGRLWVWGSGKNGRLGLGSPVDEPSPFPLESLQSFPVVDVACGFDHTLVLLPNLQG